MSTNDFEMSEEHFEKPEWAMRQAFLVGYKKALKEIDKILDLKSK